MLMDLPTGFRAGAILADPGIAFRTRSAKGEARTPQRYYRCPPFAELASLPVASVAAPNAFLLLWMPLRSVDLVKPLMQAWGFRFSGSGFVWIKTNKDGSFFMGAGYSTRKNAEICWLGRRGSPPRKSKAVRELIIAPRRQHSRKPDEIYARIEALCDGPFAELFARQQWPGWLCAGDESKKFQPRQIQGADK